MHFDVVLAEFIHPCTNKSWGEVNSVSTQSWRGCLCACFRCVCACFRCVCACFRCVCACASDVCVRVLQMCVCVCFRCVRGKLLTQRATVTPTIPSVQAVLISSPDTWDWTRIHALVVMHRRTLCENVDSAKIKVPFYRYRYFMHGIAIDASYRYIDPYRWTVTPLE